MTKTTSVNLSNILFSIDENAYNELNKYLENLNNHFENSTDKLEIIADIENSIAHKLTLKGFDNQAKSIDLISIKEIIQEIGIPENLDEDSKQNSTSSSNKSDGKIRRLYRDVDHKMLGGVCAGVAAYCGWDILIVRICTVLLTAIFQGLLVPVYLITWLIIPEAKTVAEKMEMKGQTVNIYNIIENILNKKDSNKM